MRKNNEKEWLLREGKRVIIWGLRFFRTLIFYETVWTFHSSSGNHDVRIAN